MIPTTLLKQLFLVSFLCIFAFVSNAQITFVNPDIENPGCATCFNCTAPSWTNCAATPDIQPGQYGVAVPAKSGCTYAGFAEGEYIGQKLSCALIPGKTYRLSAWLAYDPIYCARTNNGVCTDPGSRGNPGNLLVFAGNTQCSTNELLWQSGILPVSADKNWTEYQITFTPVGGPYDFVMFQNNVSASNILIDNISEEIETVVPTVNIIKNEPSCVGGNDAEVSISVLGLYLYDFHWSNGFIETGVTTSTNNALAAGNHTVTIKDPIDLCVGNVVIPFTINTPPPILLSTTQSDETCPGLCDGSATVSVNSGGTAPFTYLWDDPASQTDSTAVNLCAGAYNVIVTDLEGCDTSISVTINTIGVSADPGVDATIDVCDTETDINLFSFLGGTPDYGGTWTDENSSGGLTDSTLDATGLSGTYTFKHTVGESPCIYNALLTVNVSVQYDAGIGYTDSICQDYSGYKLTDKLVAADTDGVWLDDPINPGGLNGEFFDATQVVPGIYHLTYVVDAVAPCVPDSAFVSIIVKHDPVAGNDTTIFVCNTSAPIDLYSKLGGMPDIGGTWNDDDATNALTNGFLDVTTLTNGNYEFTYTLSDNLPCLGKAAVLTVVVQEQLDAGLDNAFDICKDAPAFNFLDSLNGTPNAGGIWRYRDGGNAIMGSQFNPLFHLSGRYDYTIDGAPSCQTVSSTLTITVNEKPTVDLVIDTLCDPINENYQVRIEISGGDSATYVVNGNSVGSSTFISSWIPTGNNYSFDVDDINACGPITIAGGYACDCATRAGNMDLSLLDVCEDQLAIAIHDTLELVTDPNDSLIYVLHTSPSSNLGTILDTNLTAPEFYFNENNNMQLETTYYISAVVGNGLLDETVDLTDLCLSVAPGTPVAFHELPDAIISNDTLICEGQTATLNFNFTKGNAPYEVVINNGFVDSTYTGLISGSTVAISPSTTTTYSIVSVKDKYNCTQIISGQNITVTVNELPDANFNGIKTTFCDGTGPALMEFDITRGVPSFDLTYYDAQLDSIFTKHSIGTGITPFSNNDLLTPGIYNYRLLSITDNSSAGCNTLFNDTVTITVYENPDITISGNNTICDGDSTQLTVTLTDGLANFNIDYSLNNISQTQKLNQTNPTSFYVSPTVGINRYNIDRIEDANGCITTFNDTDKVATINVNPNPTVVISPSNLTFCEGTDTSTFTFNFPIGSPNFELDYQINGGVVQTISGIAGNGFSWDFPRNNVGVYNLSFIELRDANCSSTLSDNFTITINQNPTADIRANRYFVCEYDSTQFHFDFGGDSPWYVEYDIDGGSTIVESSANNTLTRTLNNLTTSTTINLHSVTSSVTGCTKHGINKAITIIVNPEAIIEITGNNTICDRDSSEIKITVLQGNGPFDINFNDGISGKYINGNTLIKAPSDTSVYKILDFEDIAGCPGTIAGDSVVINVIELPTIEFGPDTNICEGQSTQLRVDFGQGVGHTYTVTLDNQDFTVTNGEEQLVSPASTTTYTIDKVIDGSGYQCTNTDSVYTVKVEVTPLPSGTISQNDSICFGDSTQILFDLTGYAPFDLSYRSNGYPSDTLHNVNGLTTSKTVSPDLGITEYYMESVKMVEFPYCAAPKDSLHGLASVLVSPIPEPRFNMKDLEACSPAVPTFINLTDKKFLGTSYWYFGVGETFIENDSIFNRTVTVPRSYKVTLTVESPFGCINSTTHSDEIVVHPYPVADFTFNPEPATIANEFINFRNQTTGGAEYEWEFFSDRAKTDLNATYTETHPQHPTPQQEGEYLMRLSTYSKHGCFDQTEQIVTVLGEMLINVPNTFTPNGDGVNDTFEPVIFGAKTDDFVFMVFDRWGEQIYQSADLNNKAWNGKYRGVFSKDGLYVYKVIARSKFTDKIEEIEGIIRLLR